MSNFLLKINGFEIRSGDLKECLDYYHEVEHNYVCGGIYAFNDDIQDKIRFAGKIILEVISNENIIIMKFEEKLK